MKRRGGCGFFLRQISDSERLAHKFLRRQPWQPSGRPHLLCVLCVLCGEFSFGARSPSAPCG